MVQNHRFLKACRREKVDATPIWLMRQAGRYMPEYRALREKYTLLEMIKTPDLATEVTLQPVHAFDVDAAILFADILTLLETLGFKLEFVEGEGPLIHNPIRTPQDVDRLTCSDIEESLHFTLQAIRQVRVELDEKIPLIGFSGAPFTLACYALEGKSSQPFTIVQSFMHTQSQAWRRFMEKLSQAVGTYLQAQVKAGVQALQLFDSWAGLLSSTDYREYVLPYSQEAMRQARFEGIPLIHFSAKTSAILPLMKEAGGDVIGIDSDMDLAMAWRLLGDDVGIQGNLNPAVLADASWKIIKQRAARILDSVKDKPGHIFNLGHGVLKRTPVEHVAALVEFVHAYSS